MTRRRRGSRRTFACARGATDRARYRRRDVGTNAEREADAGEQCAEHRKFAAYDQRGGELSGMPPDVDRPKQQRFGRGSGQCDNAGGAMCLVVILIVKVKHVRNTVLRVWWQARLVASTGRGHQGGVRATSGRMLQPPDGVDNPDDHLNTFCEHCMYM